MASLQQFLNKCKEHGLNKNAFVTGTTQVVLKSSGRYVKDSSPFKRSAENKFVVLYVEKGDFYIAWSLSTHKAATKRRFTVSANKVNKSDKSRVAYINKHIEYSGWNDETVFVFGTNTADEFLRTVVCHHV